MIRLHIVLLELYCSLCIFQGSRILLHLQMCHGTVRKGSSVSWAKVKCLSIATNGLLKLLGLHALVTFKALILRLLPLFYLLDLFIKTGVLRLVIEYLAALFLFFRLFSRQLLVHLLYVVEEFRDVL